MDADVLAEIKSRPFLRLHLEPRGPAVIAKILTYALQPVDVFVTKLPRDAQRCRFIRRVGPTPVWLTIRGFKQRSKIDEKTGVSECLVETNDAGQQAPSWYVARIETKLGVVCKSWKNIMDGNDAGNPMVVSRKLESQAHCSSLMTLEPHGSVLQHLSHFGRNSSFRARYLPLHVQPSSRDNVEVQSVTNSIRHTYQQSRIHQRSRTSSQNAVLHQDD